MQGNRDGGEFFEDLFGIHSSGVVTILREVVSAFYRRRIIVFHRIQTFSKAESFRQRKPWICSREAQKLSTQSTRPHGYPPAQTKSVCRRGSQVFGVGRKLPRVMPAQREMAGGRKLEREPDVTGFGQLPLVPAVGEKNKEILTALDGKNKGALRPKRRVGVLSDTRVGQFAPGTENRVRHRQASRVRLPAGAA